MQAGGDLPQLETSSPLEEPQFELTAAATSATPYATAEKHDTVMAEYTVTVYTSDLPGAGTDCAAYISVHGKAGQTGRHALIAQGGAFVRGSVETALVRGPDVGQMLHICVGHNDEGMHDFLLLAAVCYDQEKQ